MDSAIKGDNIYGVWSPGRKQINKPAECVFRYEIYRKRNRLLVHLGTIRRRLEITDPTTNRHIGYIDEEGAHYFRIDGPERMFDREQA